MSEVEESSAGVFSLASLDPEQRSSFLWAVARRRKEQGEGLKEALIWAIRHGVRLPDDLKERAWIADALEGKFEPKRGKGRPRGRKPPDIQGYVRAIMEDGMVQAYYRWLADFQRNRGMAWLRFEALRLRQEKPDAAVWRRDFDLGKEADRQTYAEALAALGARPCPPALKGEQAPSELAREATVREYKQRWAEAGGRKLTPSFVARAVTRAENSE